jgi:hypothetical protein
MLVVGFALGVETSIELLVNVCQWRYFGAHVSTRYPRGKSLDTPARDAQMLSGIGMP